ncbi:hypothetical protein [Anabaena azotica]|uniref:Uncharacterized protein n=1 Tax=Anabaena azotica FACHB-119 TaxID=947527 RepID=A0ABR8DBL9_9NOST|nr:hypothetical protein [Anabaena azotica]MBD2503123.1 hypothetical protein [Anabaena azotica FACHB-119]
MVFPVAFESNDENKPTLRFKDKSGIEHPYLVADSALAKRLSGLTQIMHDLNHAHELMSMIKDIENSEVAYSLWMSAIVTYGKCFATAKGRRSKIEEDHVRRVDEDAIEFHNSILNMRNEYFAHAGVNEYERASTVVILQPESQGKSVVAVSHFNVKHSKPSEEFCICFCYLCQKLYDVIESIGKDVHQRVLEEYRAMNVDELYAKTKT